jgi:hypothetical protein
MVRKGAQKSIFDIVPIFPKMLLPYNSPGLYSNNLEGYLQDERWKNSNLQLWNVPRVLVEHCDATDLANSQ